MRSCRTTALICLLAALSAACQPAGGPTAKSARPRIDPNPRAPLRGEITTMGFDEFFLHQQNSTALILDARPTYFHRLGHIPGSLGFPAEEARERLDELLTIARDAQRQQRPIVVYCHGMGCHDAGDLARLLSRQTIPVAIFSQGWTAWKKAGLPTESTLQVPAESANPSAP